MHIDFLLIFISLLYSRINVFSEESVGSSVQCHLKSICNYIYDSKTVQRWLQKKNWCIRNICYKQYTKTREKQEKAKREKIISIKQETNIITKLVFYVAYKWFWFLIFFLVFSLFLSFCAFLLNLYTVFFSLFLSFSSILNI